MFALFGQQENRRRDIREHYSSTDVLAVFDQIDSGIWNAQCRGFGDENEGIRLGGPECAAGLCADPGGRAADDLSLSAEFTGANRCRREQQDEDEAVRHMSDCTPSRYSAR